MGLEASGTVPAGSTEQWRDRKRHLWLLGLVVPSLPFVAIAMHAGTGWGAWWWIGPVVILGIVPAVDLVAGLDQSNPPDELIQALESDRYYRWVTVAYLPLQYVGLVAAAWLLVRGDLAPVDRLGLAVTLGVVGGIAINTAHELGHKRESVERWLSKLALAQSGYGHFYIEHNRGHHVRVATPEDPATARFGESVYRFLPRTVHGSVRSAWRLEKRRYARRGHHPLRLGNDVLNAWVMTLALWGALLLWLGPALAPYLLIQSLIAVCLLEIVNYLEHYGMRRERVGTPGRERWERVDPSHSWNSNNVATNVLLYHLQRHSDHHANPTRRYQALRDYAESPALPTGYSGMILLALVPPLWRRVMDPRVVAHDRAATETVHLDPSPPTPPAAGEAAPAPGRSGAGCASGGRCPGCGYEYDEAGGAPREGFPAGTPWAAVPGTWPCPDCGVREKQDFVPRAAADR